MKLNDKMRYPHPVLSEYSSDYVSGEFRCEFEQNLTPENELRITADLSLTDGILARLVEEQKASVGYFIVCRRTYFNRLQDAPLGYSEKFFDASRLFDTVLLRPVVWSLQTLEEFSSPLFNEEFGDSVRVPKGCVIALGREFRFSIDRKKYKPFDSIFKLAEDSAVPAGTVVVDPGQEKITISAAPATFKAIAGMRGMAVGRKILLGSLYMPAVMEVLSRLQSGDRTLEGCRWYRVFRAKCDDLAIDPADNNRSPLELSQKLLRQPFTRTVEAVESLS